MKLISNYVYDKYKGGMKAKADIEEIFKKNSDIKIESVIENEATGDNFFLRSNAIMKKRFYILKNIFYSDGVIIQVPFANNKFMKLMKNKIAFIHDIHGLQFNQNDILKDELDFYKSCKFLVVHNEKMKKYLEQNGIDSDKMIILELFDYLCEEKYVEKSKNDISNLHIVYSGNLIPKKIQFLYQINEKDINFNINLYGKNVEKIANKNIAYMGSYSPSELPNKIQGDLGLVWDGNFDESDENYGLKMYSKYNNPHKLSCYIAAGLPVIVWRKAAIADFVKKYNIGYTISNIYDINNLDLESYDEKLKNVQDLSRKVRDGYFTKRVMNKILEDMKKNDES